MEPHGIDLKLFYKPQGEYTYSVNNYVIYSLHVQKSCCTIDTEHQGLIVLCGWALRWWSPEVTTMPEGSCCIILLSLAETQFEDIPSDPDSYAGGEMYNDSDNEWEPSTTAKSQLAFQTNLYAQQESKPYKPTTAKELRTFLGINLLMGIKRTPSYRNHWSRPSWLVHIKPDDRESVWMVAILSPYKWQ